MNNPIMYLAAVAWANGGTLRGANLQHADLRGADLGRVNLQGADLWRADLGRANLQCANLQGANLQCADLRGADFWLANLWRADLRGASLQRANLQGANLREANYDDDTLAAYVTTVGRGDYDFRLFRLADGSHKVMAGCRWLTIPDYRAHVAAKYPDTDTARKTLDILDYFERRVA